MMLCAGAENRRSTSDSSKSLLVVALMQEDTHGEAYTSEQENNVNDMETHETADHRSHESNQS